MNHKQRFITHNTMSYKKIKNIYSIICNELYSVILLTPLNSQCVRLNSDISLLGGISIQRCVCVCLCVFIVSVVKMCVFVCLS